ncbi:Stp1/IreP family PP2C-type Ser/Thr phosphatase [Candidatus Epulonipiscium viviparus]|uniref:Stp1/IreP family PP2C-type Ser/Thr phosphatase n=1 Tax=Candidatus Epulonipiscium viviparus TaxID=420336 RepID=UPI00273813E2|nr:Stp1/IreP family PP2C-type Ser/Thr phosphatase [Candidatus Epulopiscium viviparus]
MISFGKVDIGLKRQTNQDNIFICDTNIGALPNLYIVADGMGGLGNGELASKIAIEVFVEYITELKELTLNTQDDIINLLNRSIYHTNYVVYNKSKELNATQGMGTTFIAITVFEKHMYIAYVGDSRAYAINDRDIIQLTIDHSLVQELYEKGMITLEETANHPMSHMITRAIGINESIKLDVCIYELEYLDYILMCSDGVTNMLPDNDIFQIINHNRDHTLETISQEIISLANSNGGHDNIALIILTAEEGVK